MKKAVAVMILLAGGLFAAPRVTFGVGFGVPAPVAVARPACPGPGYTWVDGYYAPSGVWTAGYWAAPVVRVTPPVVRVAPRYDRDHFADRARVERRSDHFRR